MTQQIIETEHKASDMTISPSQIGPVSIQDKIIPLRALEESISTLKSQGLHIVHCHGVFDLVHPGHIRHFSAAKREGDILIVTITPDRYVNKGPGRPVFNEQLRAESLAALQVVDYVAINQWPTAVETIQLLKPDVYVKGSDYINREDDITGKINDEEAAVRAIGGRIHFTDDITFSSSQLFNNFLSVYPPEVDAYLQAFRKKYSADEIIGMLDSLKSMTVMVVGEVILDEYVYGDTLGKSAKEPILALRYLSEEINVGGSVAVANHLADFCTRVELVTYLGSENSREDFIRQNLKSNVNPIFIYKPDSPTIVKRRFVEKYLVTKLLEVYEMNDTPLTGATEQKLCSVLESEIPKFDVVIAADYGHGLITRRAVRLLCDSSRFLSVNTQINAANHGFHTISLYPRADYVCVHEGEIRLDQRRRSGELEPLVRKLSERMGSCSVMVTRGNRGTLLYRSDQGFFESPALAMKVVDRVGAGDSVLAISSLCEARGFPADITGFVSNLVGAQACTILGNRSSIDRVQTCKAVEAILK
jgi:rfaE bifunctional protein kinase chain/domain/rfaE bifunctional protein nucleotidyltransferase chain/domain